mmetsp:Transcript_2655/g.6346  ORF Transcript_2655/g.6346 Transcript_2655/m.6346 type:complete len:467 (-) Transcript_2655:114-1514(-)|eukprot:CAMPEP_0116079786 /NCGR_PEP_ID=MMETSP0327-20121206/1326_1 /TAXON_ID=44447 /ORGANISM="Pseudo-nitzschia delicatissima, Strain B596" /LENGTH=466 /DNA_ID=CAMNT_0003570431 /DNA_START=104 /DNA_END=1504 /DNA_ORIENTATION=+
MNHPPKHRDDDKPSLTATHQTLESFHDDVKYLWCSDIEVYEEPPTALHFLRNHVALSRPCIIRNSILTKEQHEEATESKTRESGDDNNAVPLTMTLDDLVRLFPEGSDTIDASENGSHSLPPLCVDVTPDGHGDCLRSVAAIDEETSTLLSEEKVFVKPLEAQMNLSKFRSCLRKGRANQQRKYKYNREEILDRVFETCMKENLDKADIKDTHHNKFLQDCVLYYSRQNDCLREELSPLWNLKHKNVANVDDAESFVFPRSFPWAEEAFFGQSSSSESAGVGPDAVNLWMGDERAVSAMHKDHYENLFYVLSGEKVFGLCPPSDAPFLYEREILSGRFEVSSECKDDVDTDTNARKWSVVMDRVEEDGGSPSSDKQYSKVHWIATDLFGNGSDRSNHDMEFPLSKYAHPITVRVKAGELLYLPSLWFHRVTQTTETIGINYWYDMNFESPMWCYFHFLQQLRSQVK